MSVKRILITWLLPPGVLRLIKRIVRYKYISASDRALFRQNRQLKNRHHGRRCFILGAGSSISQQDIKKLEGEIVISVSNTFVHPDFPLIKPMYHVLPPLLKSHGNLHSENKFVGWLRAMERATGNAEMVLYIGDKDMVERNALFQNRIIHWVDYQEWDGDFNTKIDLARIPPIWSVSETALTVAVYLGFKEIYLIGIDHDWYNGLHVYFFDHKKEHLLKPDEKDIDFVDSEFQMRRHADIFRKYKYLSAINQNIFNANAIPNHYLDVFKKVEYDELFESEFISHE